MSSSSDLFAAFGIEPARPLVKSAQWREEQLFLTEPLQGDLFLDACEGSALELEAAGDGGDEGGRGAVAPFDDGRLL